MKNQQTYMFSNSATAATHSKGNVSFIADLNIQNAYVFASIVKDSGNIKCSGNGDVKNNDRAIGVVSDVAKKSEAVNVTVFGANASTLKVHVAEPILPGDLLISNNQGYAVNYEKMAEGNYYVYGIAIGTAQRGSMVEFTPVVGLEKSNN